MAPDESPAFQSLVESAGQLADLPIACLIYDNSPHAHALPATLFPCSYHHNPSNPGLAAAYEYALQQAERAGTDWLLLLDQDTTLTDAYLVELLQAASDLRASSEIGAIVPKLMQDGAVLSPHWPRGKRWHQGFHDQYGTMQSPVCVYNSGAVVRVAAMRPAGGFPQNFPLDYLDHAVFARLRAQDRKTFLLHAALPHQLESKSQDIHVELKHSRRLQAMLAAESRFYREYGSSRDRLLLLRRRAKLALGMVWRAQLRSLVALMRHTL